MGTPYSMAGIWHSELMKCFLLTILDQVSAFANQCKDKPTNIEWAVQNKILG